MSEEPKSVLLAFDWYDQRIYKGIVRYATEQKWHLSPYHFSSRLIPHGWPADGAITCYGKTLGSYILGLDMPKVDVSFADLPEPIPRVRVDNIKIAQMAAEHFLSRGFHHFAYFSWPAVDVNSIRMDNYFESLQKKGIPAESLHVIKQTSAKTLGDWDKYQQEILEQLQHLPRPLAVFAGQDNLGATLIEICLRNNIHVPEEISVLGVDNIEFLCDCMQVPLSSIDTRLEDLGYTAAEQLGRLMDGEIDNTEEPILIAPRGVELRQSTDILAVPHPAVVRALRYIKENFGEPITLEDIGQHAEMSKRGLEKAFLKHLGRSPANELRRHRIDNAKTMLTETDEKIETIARACGYSNSSNLSFAFNKDTQMSPRDYRTSFRS